MIKLVVFDWNGVLIADTQATVDIDNQLLKEMGREPISLKTYRETFTMPAKNFWLALGVTKEEMERSSTNIQESFHSLYEPRIAKVRTRTGARELLEYIKSQKIEAIILSNHTVEGIQSQLERLDIKKYFSRVIANDMHATMERKNKAEKLVELVKELPYKKSEMLIIGDSPEESEAGKLAGITTVAITGGYYSTKRLQAAEPDYLINSLTDLTSIIKKL